MSSCDHVYLICQPLTTDKHRDTEVVSVYLSLCSLNSVFLLGPQLSTIPVGLQKILLDAFIYSAIHLGIAVISISFQDFS